MNVHNAAMNTFAVQQLDLKPSDRVLEIGFGGGASLPSLVQQASFVGGVDRSEYAVERASKHFAEAVSNSRADFRQGSVESMPFDSHSFNKACTVNTVYFWKSLEAAFQEIHRMLQSGWTPGCRFPAQRAYGSHEHAGGHLHNAHSSGGSRRHDQSWLYRHSHRATQANYSLERHCRNCRLILFTRTSTPPSDRPWLRREQAHNWPPESQSQGWPLPRQRSPGPMSGCQTACCA